MTLILMQAVQKCITLILWIMKFLGVGCLGLGFCHILPDTDTSGSDGRLTPSCETHKILRS